MFSEFAGHVAFFFFLFFAFLVARIPSPVAWHKCGLPFIKQKSQAFKFSGAVTSAFAEFPLSSAVKLALSENVLSLTT